METYSEPVDELTQVFIPLTEPDSIPDKQVVVIQEEDSDSEIDPQALIGSDDRYLVQNPFATPNIQVVFVESDFQLSDGSYARLTGSGTLVGKKTVLTAAHMFYQKKYGYVDVIKIYIGYSGASYKNCYSGQTAIVLPGYKKHIDDIPEKLASPYGDDIGIITMNGTPGSTYGYLNAASTGTTGQWFTTYGYPGDKVTYDKTTGERKSVQQWGANGQITSFDGYYYRHTADTQGGQSGSPLINSSNEVIAVHAGGTVNKYNIASPVSNGIIELISSSENGCFPIYRLYNKNTGEHFYTATFDEANNLVNLGWQTEGVAWSTGSSGTPVYRLYNVSTGEHHYTVNTNEVDSLVKAGWKKEMIAWYAPTTSTRKVYRLYNPQKQSFNHHYTVSLAEKNSLIAAGWKDEGITWYAY